ncbi:hypothetical protein CB0940_03111 [Cercospora beticola]|uniref:Uncharacterized protein n=1 Tax=Cercospora beticola TaxID=122368 RepID=A0A2G5I2A3_CERBT|nr:hypothetical protein CB0940_03111 [Cercospora beticola]PIA98891.1 hypothetical protein CB0940_03111 [Cercospora beticola]
MRWRARGGHDTESIGRDRSQVPTEAQLTRNMGRPGYRGISFRVCRTLRGVYPIGLASVPIFLLNALCLCLSPPTFNRHSNPLTSQPSPNHILAIHTNIHINTPVRPQDIASLYFSSVFRALFTIEHYQRTRLYRSLTKSPWLRSCHHRYGQCKQEPSHASKSKIPYSQHQSRHAHQQSGSSNTTKSHGCYANSSRSSH